MGIHESHKMIQQPHLDVFRCKQCGSCDCHEMVRLEQPCPRAKK